MPRKVFISGIVLLLVILLTGAGVFLLVKTKDNPQPNNDNTISRVFVEVQDVVPQPYTRWVEAYSTVAPSRKGLVSTQVSGPIVRIGQRAEPGTAVKKGEELARIEDIRYRLAFKKATAGLEKLQALLELEKNENEKRVLVYDIANQRFALAQSDYERHLELLKKEIIARKTLENAQNELEVRRSELEKARSDVQSREARIESIRAEMASARAEMDRLQEDLSDTTIRAPFDGVIGERFSEIGDLVAPGQRLFTVLEISSVKVVARFASEFVSRIKTGTRVEVTTKAYPQTQFTGLLVHIYPEADPKNRTFGVEISVDNRKPPVLLPGMFARVRVPVITLDRAILIPREALMEDERGFYLYVAERSTRVAHRRDLVVGDLGSEMAWVKDGVRAGETIVVRGKERLQNGTPLDWGTAKPNSSSGDLMGPAK